MPSKYVRLDPRRPNKETKRGCRPRPCYGLARLLRSQLSELHRNCDPSPYSAGFLRERILRLDPERQTRLRYLVYRVYRRMLWDWGEWKELLSLVFEPAEVETLADVYLAWYKHWESEALYG